MDTTTQDERPKCKFCGAPFNPKRWWQKFCSTKCKNDLRNQQIRDLKAFKEARSKESS